jgi:hypothetical protein
MKLSLAIETLLPAEHAPFLTNTRERYGRSLAFVLFGHRLIVDCITR